MYSGSSHAKNQAKSMKFMNKATNYASASNNEANLIKTQGSFFISMISLKDQKFIDFVESAIEKSFSNLKKSVDKMQIQDYKLRSNQFDQIPNKNTKCLFIFFFSFP